MSSSRILIVALACLACFASRAAIAATGSTDDGCSLLTQAEVSAALGESSGPCEYITPTFKGVGTWHVGASTVTVSHQTVSGFSGAKAMFGAKATITTVSGVGDDAYYLAVGDQVGLIVKKGGSCFKVAVYKHVPLETKEAIEKALALNAVARL
jgi:hypothetical protein